MAKNQTKWIVLWDVHARGWVLEERMPTNTSGKGKSNYWQAWAQFLKVRGKSWEDGLRALGEWDEVRGEPK